MKPTPLRPGFAHPRIAVVLHDLAMVWLAWTAATRLRYSLVEVPPELPWFSPEIAIVLVAQGLVLWWTGLYRGLWRFASLPDLVNIGRAAVFGAIASALGLFLFSRLEGVPRSVLFIYPLLLAVLLGLPRLLYRTWKDGLGSGGARGRPATRVLVLGAGRSGEALVRELRRENRYRVVGFLDDQRVLRGAKLHGIPVLGAIDELPRVAAETAAGMLLIAMPSASNQQMQRVVEACEDTGLAFRTVPRLQDVVEGRLPSLQLKEVAIEDLLGREPVSLDWSAIRAALAGRRVLVTGGGGSVGAELCRQVARLGIESLTVLELSEYNLYRIEQELRGEFPDLVLDCLLGDCGDPATAERALERSAAQVVFHAAAFKHVPLLQQQVREAVRNNVLTTRTLAYAALRHRVGAFVLISTDKAVNPGSVMGTTKRVAELLCQALDGTGGTRFMTVRFGNVLDSAGSVVPLFREQLRRGGPLTVTHPEVMRFFMTIPEACQLILQAVALGRGGELYALDMGEPVRIGYLAEQMIRLAGKRPGPDIEIVYTGLRPGEKLFEELFHEQEDYQPTGHPKIMLARQRGAAVAELEAALNAMHQAVLRHDEAELDRLLRRLVPEYTDAGARVVSLNRSAADER
ncbi:MAG TPA: nucleoside-diphosphate sugar epimerase/dehydratase [Xanthomonadaceae bacterium]|nr:nucleoside-diphosphate sugar epimerase/dehydratase [Xanthomonadaceae bacterium]